MYDIDSAVIAGLLFVSMIAAIEVGFRLGLPHKDSTTERTREHLNTMQGAVLGLLTLLLAFSFSLAVQRFDVRSDAVVNEANAMGTAWLRADLLPPGQRQEVKDLLRQYVDLRVQAASVSMVEDGKWEALLAKATAIQAALWQQARQAAEARPNPVTGLFIQALNELIDSFGRRLDTVTRHVPELVLFLLYGTLLVAHGVVGFTAGVGGQRPSITSFTIVALICGVLFVILDLDRPRRGFVTVSHQSLLDLQASIKAEGAAPNPPPAAAASPASGAQR